MKLCRYNNYTNGLQGGLVTMTADSYINDLENYWAYFKEEILATNKNHEDEIDVFKVTKNSEEYADGV